MLLDLGVDGTVGGSMSAVAVKLEVGYSLSGGIVTQDVESSSD